jgi:hypothetical protein
VNACTNCGFGITSDDAFCASCGSAQAATTAQGNADWSSSGNAGPSAVPAWARSTAVTYTALGQPAEGASSVREPASSFDTAGEAYSASPAVMSPARPATSAGTRETTELRYMRQTRNACVFIAVIVGIFTTLVVIGAIWGAVTLNNLHNEVNNLNNLGTSNCQSQGGTDPSC